LSERVRRSAGKSDNVDAVTERKGRMEWLGRE
jgi:hypothetical protein